MTLDNVQTARLQADVRQIVLQDRYKSPKVAEKQTAVATLLEEAKTASTDYSLYLNFTSFVWKPWEPVWSGEAHMTPFLMLKNRALGDICVDSVTEALASHIIGWN